jgi:hypothetical protein
MALADHRRYRKHHRWRRPVANTLQGHKTTIEKARDHTGTPVTGLRTEPLCAHDDLSNALVLDLVELDVCMSANRRSAAPSA